MKKSFAVYAILAFSSFSLAQVSAQNEYNRYNCVVSKIISLQKTGFSDKVQLRSVGPKICHKLNPGDTLAYAQVNNSDLMAVNNKYGDGMLINSDLRNYFSPDYRYSQDGLTTYHGEKTINFCWGSEKNNFKIISLNSEGFAAILDEDGGMLRYIEASEILLESKAHKEIEKCDKPMTINAGPHAPIFSK